MADPLFTLDGRLNISPQEESAFRRRLKQIESSLPGINLKINGGGFGALNEGASQFSNYLDRANQRVIAFTSSVSVLYSVIKTFKDIVTATIEVDKALTDINSTMRLSTTNLDKFGKDLFAAARATSSSFTEAAEAAKAFTRQGLSVEETLKRTKDALTLSRIAGVDATESVKELTEAVNIFQRSGVTTTDVVRAFANVSSNFSVSAKDLGDAFTRFGAVAQNAGLSFTQTIGLITALKVSSQRDGAAIGSALTSIFEKLAPKSALDDLNRLGVAVKDANGNYLSTINVVQALSQKYGTLSTANQAVIDKMIGGNRQIEILKSGLAQLANASGTYAAAQRIAASGADDVNTRLQAQNSSISALLQNYATLSKQVGSNIGQLSFAPALKGVFGDGTKSNPIIAAFEDASGHAETAGGKIAEGLLRGLGNAFIYGLAPILALAGSKIAFKSVNSLFNDIKDQAGLNDAAKQQETIQRQIVTLYAQGGEQLQAQLASMTTLAERATYLAAALRSAQVAQVSAKENLILEAGLVSKLIPHAAGGYLSTSQEAEAIAAGIGGAPSSAHPVVIPNFRYGPGQTGPIVANSSEYRVSLGSSDAIYSQDMVKQLGLPGNAVPIAAGGYTPFDYGDLRTSKGYNVGKEGIGQINELISTLSQSNGQNIAGVAAAIKDFIATLNDLSKSSVQRAVQAASVPLFNATSSQASPYVLAAFYARRQASAGFGSAPSSLGPNAAVPFLDVTAVEKALQKDLRGLSNEHLDTLSFASGGNGAGLNRGELIQSLRGELSAKPTDVDRIATTIGLGRSGTLNSDFANSVKTALGQGTSLEDAYKEASDAYRLAGGSAKRLASVQTSLLESMIQFENGIKFDVLNQKATQGAISRQTVLNSAKQLLAQGASFETPALRTVGGYPTAIQPLSLNDAHRTAITNELRSQAINKLGFGGQDVGDVLANPAARYQVQALVAQQLAQIKGGTSINGLGLGNPTPSLYSRLNSRLSSGNLGLAASLGLPFLGGLVAEAGGDKGTVGDRTVGLASGALNGAGLGAGVGLLVGNPLAGAIIGGGIGAIKGFLDHLTQSFEDLANDVQTRNNAIKATYDKAAKVFEIQDQLTEAIRSKADPETINRLKRNQSEAIGGITDDRIKSLIVGGLARDPVGTAVAVDQLHAHDSLKSNTSTLFTAGALALQQSSEYKPSNIHLYDTSQHGGSSLLTGGVPGISFEPSVSKDSVSALATFISTQIAGLSEGQLKSVKEHAQRGPEETLQQLARIGNVPQSVIDQYKPGLFTDTDVRSKTLNAAYEQAFKGNAPSATEDANVDALKAGDALEETIRGLGESFQFAAKGAEIFSQAYTKITEAIQKTILATTLQTEGARITQQGQFDQANIATTFAGQRAQIVGGGRASLLAAVDKGNLDPLTEKTQTLLDSIRTASSPEDFAALQTRFKATGQTPLVDAAAAEYQKALKEVTEALKVNTLSEQVSAKIADTTNKLLGIQNTSREKDTLLANARFSTTDLSNIQFQSRLGNSGFSGRLNIGTRQQSLLNEQSSLTSLGLPQTQQSLEYVNGLQGDRTRSTIAQLLSNRTGRTVGADDDSLNAAAKGLDLRVKGNAALQSRVLAAVDPKTGLLNFDPDAAIKKVQTSIGGSPADFAKSLSLSGVDGGTKIIATGLDKIALLLQSTNLLLSKGATKGVAGDGGATTDADAEKTSDTSFDPQSVNSLSAYNVKDKKSNPSNPFSGFGAGFQKVADDYQGSLAGMAQVGASVADSLQSHFASFWDNFATGAKKSQGAFKEMLASITGDASKAFANQAFQQLFSGLFGSSSGGGGVLGGLLSAIGIGHADGGAIGFAKGGKVPAMLTGGEYYVSPHAARSIGYDRLNAMNKGYAAGGLVTGGSGLRDDVPAVLDSGSFILRKSAVARYGAGSLNRMVSRYAGGGRVDSVGPYGEDDGGIPSGDITGYSGAMGQGTSSADGGFDNATSQSSSSYNIQGSATSALASLVLLLVERFLAPRYGLLDTAQTTANANNMRNSQQGYFSNPASTPGGTAGAGGVNGGFAYLSPDGNGGYKVINYGGAAASVTNFSNNADGGAIGFDGGGAVAPAPMSIAGGGGTPQVSTQITIHNYGAQGGGVSSNTKSQGNDQQSQDFAKKMGDQVEAKVREVLQTEMRSGGIFSQQRRYFPSSGQ